MVYFTLFLMNNCKLLHFYEGKSVCGFLRIMIIYFRIKVHFLNFYVVKGQYTLMFWDVETHEFYSIG